MYSLTHTIKSFSNKTSRSSRAPASDASSQPRMSALRENRLEPRIDIHSIDYEFPLQIKNRKSSTDQSSQNKNSSPVFSTKTTEQEEKIAVSSVNEIEEEEMSGMTMTSFIESIRFNDHGAIKMHLEAGFKGDTSFIQNSATSTPIDFAIENGYFDAAFIILPKTKPNILMEAMNKRQEFFDEHTDLALNLLNTLFVDVRVSPGLSGAV